MTIREFVLTVLEPILHPERKPNQETRNAMAADRQRQTVKANDIEDLCDKLGI